MSFEPRQPWRTLAEMIEGLALDERTAPRTAVTVWDGARSREELTAREIGRRARAAAAALRARGLEPGDRVALVLSKPDRFVTSFFGIVLAGGVPVPLTPPTGLTERVLEPYEDTLGRMLEAAGAIAIVCERRVRVAIGAWLDRRFPDGIACSPPFDETPVEWSEVARPRPEDTAFLQFTSGSTSEPKGVDLPHRSVLANVAAIEAVLGGRPGDVTVSWLPLHHDMGLIGGLLTALYAEVPVVLLTPQSFARHPRRWLEAVTEHRGTITVAPNFAFGYCLSRLGEDALDGLDLSSLRVVLNGAEPVDGELIHRFEDRFARAGLPRDVVRPVYGLAESTLAVTFADPGAVSLDVVERASLEREGRARPARRDAPSEATRAFASVGRPLPTQELRVVGRDGSDVPDRSVGEILVRGPSVMRGYWERPSTTAETLVDGWLHTGDLGYRADGHLYIVGRAKDVIVHRGRNIHPEDLERTVVGVEGVRKGGAAVFGVPSGDGEAVVVAVESALRDDEKRAELAREVGRRVASAHGLHVDVTLLPPRRLAKSTSGKVRRQITRGRYLDRTLDQPHGDDDRISFTRILRGIRAVVARRGRGGRRG